MDDKDRSFTNFDEILNRADKTLKIQQNDSKKSHLDVL